MPNRLADEAAYFGAIRDDRASQPRALCAESDDRQWLVVLGIEPLDDGCIYWHLYEWKRYPGFHDAVDAIEDIGQSAEDVLRELLERRGG